MTTQTPDAIIAQVTRLKVLLKEAKLMRDNGAWSSYARKDEPVQSLTKQITDLENSLPFWPSGEADAETMFALWDAMGRPGNQGPDKLDLNDLMHLATRHLSRAAA